MENDLNSIKNLLWFCFAVLIAYLLSVLAGLMIPLAMALFVAILLQPTLAWFERKNIGFGISLTVISVTSLSALALFGILVYKTGKSLMVEKEKLLFQINAKLSNIVESINNLTGVYVESSEIVDNLGQLLSTDWLVASSGTFAGMLGSFTGTFLITALYLVAFLSGILEYEKYIHYLQDDEKESQKMIEGFEQVKESIVTYIKVKFLMSLCTGIGYGLICWMFGIDFALFWGYLAFVLNFIPTVGSIVATIPPLLLGLIQLDSTGAVLGLISLLFVVQFTFGNIIEPRLMGKSLSLNTVVVILGLVFWGYLWGVAGMVLSVPMLVLTKVILAQFDGAKIVVRLMGSSKIEG
ncbi:MAG: pheromone autoinducer 2 transporter [Cyclobacteriaceae bacterium]|nr:MAG: pheromone autoinducer 2 transporter [Cyclobacteriaceae bacterium]